MTAPREDHWHTVAGGQNFQTDMTIELLQGPGTVLRMLGKLLGTSVDPWTAAVTSFQWMINVGTAAGDPNVFGLDPESTMLHEATFIQNVENRTVDSPVPPVTFDSAGKRIILANESLWLRMREGDPPIRWTWTWTIRVLLQDP